MQDSNIKESYMNNVQMQYAQHYQNNPSQNIFPTSNIQSPQMLLNEGSSNIVQGKQFEGLQNQYQLPMLGQPQAYPGNIPMGFGNIPMNQGVPMMGVNGSQIQQYSQGYYQNPSSNQIPSNSNNQK